MSDSMKAQRDKNSPTAGDPTTTRGDPGRRPRATKHDCTQPYNGRPLSSIDSETSPSAGWRATYTALSVSTRQHEER